MKKIVLNIIRMYQKTLSPDHGFIFSGSFLRCRFYPSCSQYTHDAIEKYGIVGGGARGVKRIFRCNPFSKGGVDLA
ncbi:MAG: membrane protein insertion efficiency factor YidD [Candidatus Paceibacterota bacterium]